MPIETVGRTGLITVDGELADCCGGSAGSMIRAAQETSAMMNRTAKILRSGARP